MARTSTITASSLGTLPSKGKLARVGKSLIHGYGVYAEVDLALSTPVCRYDGRRLSAAEAVGISAIHGRYWLQLPNGDLIDGAAGSQPGRWVNHACDPNVEWAERDGEVWATTIRRVSAGEELTVDYGFGMEDLTSRWCRCGGPRCVGFVVAQAYHPLVRLLYP